LTAEFARANNNHAVLRFKDYGVFYIKFENFQGPTLFSRTFKVVWPPWI